MEKHFLSFLDSDFLIEFMALQNTLDKEDIDDPSLDVWRSLLKFIRRKSNLELKINTLKLNELAYHFESALLRELLQKIDNGSLDIKLAPNNLSLRLGENCPLNKYDFVFDESGHTSEEDCKSFGVPYIKSFVALHAWKNYWQKDTVTIPARDNIHCERTGWNHLGLSKYELNSIIIHDNYILGFESNIQGTILPLLDFLLPPQDMEIELDLTIFSSKFYNCNIDAEITKEKIIEVHERLLNTIRNYLNFQKINFSLIYHPSSKYHGRQIFTNRVVFQSDNSFTYFDEDNNPIIPSETIMNIHPLPADNINSTHVETYLPFLKRLKKIADRSEKYAGSKINRLFDRFN